MTESTSTAPEILPIVKYPDPFLRRCIFHFIEFPDAQLMEQIVRVHHPEIDNQLVEQCLAKFYWLRDIAGLRKRPSTSELVDWIGALIAEGVPAARLSRELPFLGALIKREEDVEAVAKAVTGTAARRPWNDD